jgi:hypothetical protein
LAQEPPFGLALDIDVIKHSLGQWRTDATAAGYQARRLAVAMVTAHLDTGHDVYVGQYLAQPEFVDDLRLAAESCGATFTEVVLVLDEGTLASRLELRRANPDRPEHLVNNTLIAPHDAAALVEAMAKIASSRESAIFVEASGTVDGTVELVRGVLRTR